MTDPAVFVDTSLIIPYQELLGNYDAGRQRRAAAAIIPYQELLGNYDCPGQRPSAYSIIPYQELLGNYDQHHSADERVLNYTIPRAIREL